MPVVEFVFGENRKSYEAKVGETVLELIRRYGLDYVEGACEGALACSTCHLIVDPAWYQVVETENPISDQECDMLDMAFNLSKTSRLGCQVKITENMNGVVFLVPSSGNKG